MTVQDTASFIDYVGDDVTTSFAFTFRADDISWLTVDFTDDFDTFTLNVDQDNNPGGTAEYLVAPPSPGMGGPDPSFRIERVTPNSQELNYTRYDPFDSESHESALDKLTMQVQDGVTALDTVDANLQSQIDDNNLLITTGVSPGHQHVEADIIDLGDYTNRATDEDISGFWEFINVAGIAIYDAGKAAGGQIRTATGAMELIPLLANTHVRVNGPLHVSRAGVPADEMSFTHNGVDLIWDGVNADEIQLTGFTGRITQGGEIYAYISDITAAGNLPAPANNGLLVNDSATWTESPTLTWIEATGTRGLTIDGVGAFGSDPLLHFDNIPGGPVIEMSPTISTQYIAMRLRDQLDATFWELIHDHSGGTGFHRLRWENDAGTTFMEFERQGVIRLAGTGQSANEQVFINFSGTVAVRNDATLYLEQTAANADIAGHGQLYVEASDDSLHYVTEAGVDTNLLTGGAVSQLENGGNIVTIALASGVLGLRSVGSSDAEGRLLEFQFANTTIRGNVGYSGDAILRLANKVHGANIYLTCEEAGGTEYVVAECDPDVNNAGGVAAFTVWEGPAKVFPFMRVWDSGDIATRTGMSSIQMLDGQGVARNVGPIQSTPTIFSGNATLSFNDFLVKTRYHDEGITRVLDMPSTLTGVANGSMLAVVNLGTGGLQLRPATGLSLEWWDGSAYQTLVGNGSLVITLPTGRHSIWYITEDLMEVTGPGIT